MQRYFCRSLSIKAPFREFKINFDTKNLIESFKNVPVSRLILANIVLKACQVSWVTSKLAPFYVKYALKYSTIFSTINPIIRETFFKHFCGGSKPEEICLCANRLSSLGVGSILDPAMEEDLQEVSLYPKDKILPQLNNSTSSFCNLENMNQRKLQIEECVKVAEMSAKKKTKDAATSFIAVKLTCMVPTGLLYMLTSSLDFLITELEKFPNLSVDEGFKKLDQTESLKINRSFLTLNLIKDELLTLSQKYPTFSARNLVFSLKPESLLKFYLDVYLPLYGHNEITLPNTESLLKDSLTKGIEYSKGIIEYAAMRSISVMVDAEQTYFQTSIHYLTFYIIKNSALLGKQASVYGTYQMYLKDGFSQLKQDSQLYSKYALPFALKIVRGAYMQSENARYSLLGLNSPINESIEKTHEQYSAATDYLLSSISNQESYPKVAGAFFATHNVNSIEKIISYVLQHPYPETLKNQIMIGQLLGMADHLTLSIANSNLALAYKYVPVGTLQEVLPYLLRRSQENSSLFGRATQERQHIKKVLLERLKFLSSGGDLLVKDPKTPKFE